MHEYKTDFEHAWEARVLRADLVSPLDKKARDFGVFYFNTPPHSRNISYTAKVYGIDRQTATRHLARLGKMGWIEIYPSPELAGTVTLPRVYLRKVFWSSDFWEDAGKAS